MHCKTLELPLNYHQAMARYQFRTPGKAYGMSREAWLEKCRRYLKSWVDLLKAEKNRQMALPSEMWPSPIPWEVKGLWSMPMVLWLSKPKPRGQIQEATK